MDAASTLPVILVVEDDPDLSLLVEYALSGFGAVQTAATIAAARTAVAEEEPDAVILDVLLPDGNGLDLVSELQARPGVHLPILILTGLGSGDQKVRGFDAGADDYLIKPFDVDELRVRVRALLRMRQVEKDLAARNLALNRANTVSAILLQTADALTALGDRMTVLQGALQLLPRLFGADRAAIWLLGPEQGTDGAWGLEVARDEIPQLVSGRAHPPFPTLALGERGLRIEEDVAASALPVDVRAQLDLGAFICARIARGHEAVGALLIGYARPQSIDPALQDVVSGLANQLSIAIENARLFEQLEEAALTDSSTGLRNMRFFWAALESELARARRMATDHSRDEPLSVLMMDLNKFKQYNDEYGHPIGDEALRRFGQLIQSKLRRYDTLARYGGDEFIVLLPETGAEAAEHLADRLRQKVAETLVRLSDTVEVKFSSSIGVATYPRDGATAQALVRAADDALYAEKRRTGNERAPAPAGD